VPLANLQPGDLIFFSVSNKKPSHVGIYDGRGRFLHAPSSGGSVSYAKLSNPYWRSRVIGAGRFL
jgi:cell wall-associated NlpC family hydrolase